MTEKVAGDEIKTETHTEICDVLYRHLAHYCPTWYSYDICRHPPHYRKPPIDITEDNNFERVTFVISRGHQCRRFVLEPLSNADKMHLKKEKKDWDGLFKVWLTRQLSSCEPKYAIDHEEKLAKEFGFDINLSTARYGPLQILVVVAFEYVEAACCRGSRN